MGGHAIVLGEGASARRAAAGLLQRGWTVSCVGAQGAVDAEVEGNGVCAQRSPLADELYGAAVEVEARVAEVLLGGEVRRLPLSTRDLVAAVPPTHLVEAARAWVRARGTVELKKVIGGGNETRTYADWVSAAFGEPVLARVHARYARARWGEPSHLSANVARLHHAVPPEGPRVAYAAKGLAPSGVRHVPGELLGIEAGGVRTSEGFVEGTVFVAMTPSRVASLLPQELRATLEAEAALLETRDRVEVHLRAAGDGPLETHLLDAPGGFYRLLRTGRLPGGPRDGVALHATVAAGGEVDAAAWTRRAVDVLGAMGLAADAADARVIVRRDAQPVWSGPHLARMRRHVMALASIGVVPVGREGMHAPLDLAAELAWLDAAQAALSDEKPARALREAMRTLVDPPAEDAPERPRLADLVIC